MKAIRNLLADQLERLKRSLAESKQKADIYRKQLFNADNDVEEITLQIAELKELLQTGEK